VLLLRLAQRRFGLGIQLAIDGAGVHPFGLQALLQPFESILAHELLLFLALLARGPSGPSLDHDGPTLLAHTCTTVSSS